MFPTLTIAIPTYNRSECLRLLLTELRRQVSAIPDGQVELLVSNNCSTDETPAVISELLDGLPYARVINNSINMGADFNIAQCYEASRGAYAWIMGDDDLPMEGAVATLLGLLQEKTPDLVYLASNGVDGPLENLPRTSVPQTLKLVKYSREAFARQIQIYFTFISGIVLRKQCYLDAKGTADIHKYTNTCLVQLEWTLSTLLLGDHFFHLETPIILSRANNSGGYKLFEVFSVNYVKVVTEICKSQPEIGRILIHRTLISYLPWLIFQHRFKKAGDFSTEPFLPTIRGGTADYPEYWILLAPISLLPKILSKVLLYLSKIFYKILVATDRIRYRKRVSSLSRANIATSDVLA